MIVMVLLLEMGRRQPSITVSMILAYGPIGMQGVIVSNVHGVGMGVDAETEQVSVIAAQETHVPGMEMEQRNVYT